VYDNKKRISTRMYIIVIWILILIPKVIFDLVNIEILYLKDVVNSKFYYIDVINYSKHLICVGVIFLIFSYALKTIFDKVRNKLNSRVRNYINETKNVEILK